MIEFSKEGLLADRTPKAYLTGTERAFAPSETFERFAPFMPRMGITRLADLTGLDRIKLPTFQSVRPMARSLSVNQGKGVDPMAARVSALMEAAETWHAENPIITIHQSTQAGLPHGPVEFDLIGMASRDGLCPHQAASAKMSWVKGIDLIKGRSVYVPGDAVLMDYSIPPDTDFLHRTSNGLASGNTRTEAAVAALLEVIERDCSSEFHALGPSGVSRRKLTKGAVERFAPPSVLEGLCQAGTQIQVWDMSNDIGIPAYAAILRGGKAPFSDALLRGFAGSGCHLNPVVALSRAICEAVQSRLTVISGARDDLSHEDYEPDPASALARLSSLFFEADQGIDTLPSSQAAECSADDLALICSALERVGISQITLVDLTHDEIDLPVVRAVVPGLGRPTPGHGYRLSQRQQGAKAA